MAVLRDSGTVKHGVAPPAFLEGRHFLSCASGLQEDSRGGTWTGRVLGNVSQDWQVDFPLTLKGSWDVPVLNCQLAHSMPLTCVSTPNRKNWGAQA